MRGKRISVVAALLLLCSSACAESSKPPCVRVHEKELAALASLLEKKVSELEPAYKGKIKFRSALLCGSVLSAWFYGPMQSPYETGLAHINWDLANSESSIGDGQ